jgi:hypothetical protein
MYTGHVPEKTEQKLISVWGPDWRKHLPPPDPGLSGWEFEAPLFVRALFSRMGAYGRIFRKKSSSRD